MAFLSLSGKDADKMGAGTKADLCSITCGWDVHVQMDQMLDRVHRGLDLQVCTVHFHLNEE